MRDFVTDQGCVDFDDTGRCARFYVVSKAYVLGQEEDRSATLRPITAPIGLGDARRLVHGACATFFPSLFMRVAIDEIQAHDSIASHESQSVPERPFTRVNRSKSVT